jgi:endonuclease/exonuclease/phosphatase family metal-dependent hydrolase
VQLQRAAVFGHDVLRYAALDIEKGDCRTSQLTNYFPMDRLRIILAVTLALVASAFAESPAPLRVMTFNIRNSDAKDGADHWEHRKELFAKTVRDFDPDLLGTQEVLVDQYDALGAMFSEYGVVGVARDDGKRAGEWSAIFYRKSRFDQLDAGNFWLSETPDEVGSRSWDAACTRICTWARLRDRASGKEFLYANTHFDHRGEVARLESSKLIRKRLPVLSKGSPVILMGDFNCIEDDEPYRVFRGAPGDNGTALIDSYREVHPKREQDEASFHAFKGTVAGSRIDWILHTSQFKATAAEIVHAGNGRFPSDHYPVTAVLEFE